MVIPLTIPDEEPTVAIEVDPEVHVPPAVGSVRVVEAAGHVVNVPEIPAGNGLTVIDFVTEHPPDAI